jgi:hypothetical protein
MAEEAELSQPLINAKNISTTLKNSCEKKKG